MSSQELTKENDNDKMLSELRATAKWLPLKAENKKYRTRRRRRNHNELKEKPTLINKPKREKRSVIHEKDKFQSSINHNLQRIEKRLKFVNDKAASSEIFHDLKEVHKISKSESTQEKDFVFLCKPQAGSITLIEYQKTASLSKCLSMSTGKKRFIITKELRSKAIDGANSTLLRNTNFTKNRPTKHVLSKNDKCNETTESFYIAKEIKHSKASKETANRTKSQFSEIVTQGNGMSLIKEKCSRLEKHEENSKKITTTDCLSNSIAASGYTISSHHTPSPNKLKKKQAVPIKSPTIKQKTVTLISPSRNTNIKPIQPQSKIVWKKIDQSLTISAVITQPGPTSENTNKKHQKKVARFSSNSRRRRTGKKIQRSFSSKLCGSSRKIEKDGVSLSSSIGDPLICWKCFDMDAEDDSLSTLDSESGSDNNDDPNDGGGDMGCDIDEFDPQEDIEDIEYSSGGGDASEKSSISGENSLYQDDIINQETNYGMYGFDEYDDDEMEIAQKASAGGYYDDEYFDFASDDEGMRDCLYEDVYYDRQDEEDIIRQQVDLQCKLSESCTDILSCPY